MNIHIVRFVLGALTLSSLVCVVMFLYYAATRGSFKARLADLTLAVIFTIVAFVTTWMGIWT